MWYLYIFYAIQSHTAVDTMYSVNTNVVLYSTATAVNNEELRGVLEKTTQSLAHNKFWTICRKIEIFAQNVRQRLLSANQCKIYVNVLNILC